MSIVLASNTLTDEVIKKIEKKLGKKVSEINLGVIKAAAIPYIEKNEGKDPDWLTRDLENLASYKFKINEINLDNPDFTVETYDLVYVTGGNTFYLSYWIKQNNVIGILSEYAKLKIYIGSSAGSIITMNNISDYSSLDDPKEAPERVDQGLNLVEFAIMVHWHNDKYQKELKKIEQKYLKSGKHVLYIPDEEVLYLDNINMN